MKEVQKTIKIIAICFAWFLTVTIIVSIVGVVVAVFDVSADNSKKVNTTMRFSQYDIDSVEIDNSVYPLEVVEGDEFSLELAYVNEDYKADVKNGTLKIQTDKKNSFFNFGFLNIFDSKNKGYITLYVPEGKKLKQFYLDGGVGKLNLSSVNTEKLIIDGGLGDVEGKDIYADYVKLDCGIGNVNLSDVVFGKTYFGGNTGNIKMNGTINGDTELDAGVGNIKLNLTNDIEDYNIKTDSGIGSIKLNGEKEIRDGKRRGENAVYDIEIDGGVGNIDINFNK